jgi:hypothetical protein
MLPVLHYSTLRAEYSQMVELILRTQHAEHALKLQRQLRDCERRDAASMIAGLKRSVKTWRKTAKAAKANNKRLGRHCFNLQEKLRTDMRTDRFKAMVEMFDRARVERET